MSAWSSPASLAWSAAAPAIQHVGSVDPVPTRTVPPSTLRPATTLVLALPRPVGNDGNFQVFEVSALQRELVAMNQHKAIKPLWDQGVRFGITDPFKSRHLVLINPGVSGLTARQILDRMLSG